MTEFKKTLKPYLLRAFHQWICDNDWTPFILVNTDYPGVQVPAAYITDGKIILNIAPEAVYLLQLGDEYVGFQARFSGVSHEIWVPVGAIKEIYAQENGEGIAFTDEMPPPKSPPPAFKTDDSTEKLKRGHLKIIKND